MHVLILGYVMLLDLSDVPKAESIEIKDRRYKPKSTSRQFSRMEYGEAQAGVISAASDGVYLTDWFECWEGKVGDVPEDFNPKGANGGNPLIGFNTKSNVASLADGLEVKIAMGEGQMEIEAANYADFTDDEAEYILRTVRELLAS